MEYVAWDIETVPNERAEQYFAMKEYQPDARLTDPAKILADVEKKRNAEATKAGLYWWTGKVVCICAKASDAVFQMVGDDEETLLRGFFDWADARPDSILVGKSSADFDGPFVTGRVLALDLGVPTCLRRNRTGLISDVDQIFSHSHACAQRSNLENYAWGLGMPGKNGKGSEVANMAAGGKWREIADYCANDVEITAEMMRRYLTVYEKRIV